MRDHNDDHLISRCLLGDATPQDLVHLESCPSCRLEVEQCQTALVAFRGSVRQWGQSEIKPAFQVVPRAVWLPRIQASWSVAVVLLLAVLGLKLSFQHNPATKIAPFANDVDAALLDNVRTDVARRVPSGMEPLLMLGSTFDEHGETLP